ncbi:PAS domain S-box protein [Azospirillum sp. TSO22-1]|uniref:PAS domain-containing sensor histidine kinase n=1 Tax=Azospirillum sp. TSO22-1 TaxID=716789 RepID=UPI000D616C62|nr:PAS domain S-box protein [Azospirillum sp. TSO22-1]PWC55791.1 histidine kinase [Azospirillum sp. TSO22-1]
MDPLGLPVTVIVALAVLAGWIGFAMGRRAERPDDAPHPPVVAPVNGYGDSRLRALLDTAPVGVIVNTRDGEILYRNARALEVFGQTAEEFAADGVPSLYARPGQREEYMERLYRAGVATMDEVLLRRGSGEIYVGTMTSALTEYAGRRCHITWFYDISQQVQANAEKRDMAVRLAMALEATNAAVWDADVVAGTCWWSDTFPRMLGFRTLPAMPPDFWERRLHPEDRTRVLAHIDAHLRGESAAYEYVYRLHREDGTWMWVEAKGRAVLDESGRVVRYTGIMTDISARRRQEELLRASEERLLAILEASPISVNISSKDGRWLFSNPQTARIFDLTRAQIERTSIPDLYVDPKVRERLSARLETEGAFRDAEVAFHRPDGSVVWALASWDSIEFDGESAYLTWLYDITDRKAAEAELQTAKEAAERALSDLRAAQESLIQAETMASLGQLVAGVAHEINTPIGIGLTAATHVAETTGRVRERFEGGIIRRSDFIDYLGTVGEGAKLLVANMNRAAELIQSFKQVAVDQSSGGRRAFDLKTYIGEVLFSLRPRLKRTRLAVEVECPEGLAMDSFPGALSQVLTNLTINAIVHAYAEGQSGTIRIIVEPHGTDEVELVFSDDGKGIPAEVLPRIFDPFFTTKRSEGGSGLGLHIVFNTVTQVLGGRVSVDSQVGQGTRFTLVLPRTVPQRADEPMMA